LRGGEVIQEGSGGDGHLDPEEEEEEEEEDRRWRLFHASTKKQHHIHILKF
jgi:hypothetical protein